MAHIYRTDLFAHAMNPAKEQQVKQLLRHWRRVAPLIASEQWQIFFQNGLFDKFYDDKKLSDIVGNVNMAKDLRHQIVGILESFISNLSVPYRSIVSKSNLPPDLRHQLNAINIQQAWYKPADLLYCPDPVLIGTGAFPATVSLIGPTGLVPISPEARRLARLIMSEVFKRHHKPSYHRIGMVIGKNLCQIRAADTVRKKKNGRKRHDARSTIKTIFPIWISLATTTKQKRLQVPLLANRYYDKRKGARRAGLQINERDGRIFFGLLTDIAEESAASKAAYRAGQKAHASTSGISGQEVLALDFGLRTLFGTDQGDLLGQGFLARLQDYDRKISKLAAYRQRHGLKVRCRRYDKYVSTMQAFIKNEINRVFNRLVKTHQPAHLVLERLNFRNPDLSKRLNRLLRNCGRAIIQAKLKDLEEEYSITHVEVNPAYSSQECHECGYVDKLNRTREEFKCLWCGKLCHADINAPRVFKPRRSWPDGGVLMSREGVLLERVTSFQERSRNGWRSASADPRTGNPYFQGFLKNKSLLSQESQRDFEPARTDVHLVDVKHDETEGLFPPFG